MVILIEKVAAHINKLETIKCNCCWNCINTKIVGLDKLRIGAACKKNKRKTVYSYTLKRDLAIWICDEYKPVRPII